MLQLAGIVALIAVTGMFVFAACLCIVAKVADAEIREYQRRKTER